MKRSGDIMCGSGLRGCCINKSLKEHKIINLPVRSVVISCDTQNTLARVSSTLVYVNDTPDTLECEFVFPLDARSAVYHFQAEIDGRIIVAEVQERKEAEETYERAIEAQQTAFLLERDKLSSDTFRIRVGNYLSSHGEMRISLKYVLELELHAPSESELSSVHNGAILGLTLPTVLNPRYDPHPEQSSFSKEVLLTANPYTFAFTVHISGSMRIHDVATGIPGVTYAMQFTDQDHTKATATLSLPEGHKHPEKDIQLRFLCRPAPYDEEHLKTALEYQSHIEADMGGTEVLRPLNDIFGKSITPGCARQIFLITDGDVGNTDEVISLARSNRHNSRIFTVGIGEGASTALVRGVAQAAGGRAEFVMDEEANFATKILALLRDASLPRFSNVQVECHLPQGVYVNRLPKKLDSIFEGHFVNIYLVLKGDLARLDVEDAQVTLRGKVLERPLSFTLTFSRHSAVATSLGQNDGAEQLLHRLAAKCHIEELTLANAKAEEIIAISKAFNLVSKHTSFVGVDKASKVAPLPPPVIQRKTQRYSGKGRRIMDVGMRKSAPKPDVSVSAKAKKEPSPTIPERVTSKTVELAALQSFDGSWKADEVKLYETLGMERIAVMKEKPSAWSEDGFMTALVLVYLQLRLDQEKGEWTLFAQKAIKWLNGRRGKTDATSVIDALKAKASLFPTV